jgi:hypothetical protein
MGMALLVRLSTATEFHFTYFSNTIRNVYACQTAHPENAATPISVTLSGLMLVIVDPAKA